jgi:hypothetical protein
MFQYPGEPDRRILMGYIDCDPHAIDALLRDHLELVGSRS